MQARLENAQSAGRPPRLISCSWTFMMPILDGPGSRTGSDFVGQGDCAR